MADITELWTEKDWEVYEAFNKCKTSKGRKQFIRERSRFKESLSNVVYPHIDMSLEEFCTKYNLIERDDFKW